MNDNNIGVSVLRTKLHKPRIGDNHLHRQHLLNRLARYVKGPLTLVSAPAGYGKSTLLSCWLEESGILSAWVSLDEKDNDLRFFLAYLLEAVQTLFPGSVQNTRALLSIPNLPPLSSLTHSLINELDRIDQPFVLVLDDYHFISSRGVNELVGTLLQQATSAMHLVIATRLDPPLPLVRLRARNEIGEIRAMDLRLSQEEIARYLELNGVPVEDDEISLMAARTEGWVTGLHLLTLSLKNRTDSANELMKIPPENRNIINYLVDEVLANQPEEIHDYMLATAILDRFCASLCDAVCFTSSPTLDCRMGGGKFLEWLETSDMFVIPLDENGRWFRYHHLFQKLLVDRLKNRLSKESITSLYGQASSWCAENNLIDEAIQYALSAGDLPAASKLVEQNRHTPLNQDREFILKKWLDLLPEEIVRQSPRLLLAKAWVLSFQNELFAIPPLLEAIETFPEGELKDFPWEELELFRGILAFWEGRGQLAVGLLINALEQTPAENTGVVKSISIYLAVSMQITGQGRKGVQTFFKRFYETETEGTLKIRFIASIAFIYLLSGELLEADKAVRQIKEMAVRTNNIYAEAWASYLLGIINFQWNNLEEATHHFSHALENRYHLDAGADMDSYAGLIFSCQGLHEPERAGAAIDRMFAYAREKGTSDCLARTHSIWARLNLLQGEVESAVRIMETIDISSDTGTMLFWLDVPRITRCRVMIEHKSGSDLSAEADNIREHLQFSRATHNTPQMIELLLLQTRLYQKQGQKEEALIALNEAVTLGRPGRYIRPFINMGKGFADLLTRIPGHGKNIEFVGEILRAFDIPGKKDGDNASASGTGLPPEIPNQTLPEPLTRRELEVLSLLEKGLRNKEIAEKLFVSPETVKKHAVKIYRKLDAPNRQQAVVKAYQLGLIRQSTGER